MNILKMNDWQEKEVYNVTDAGIEEVQSARCPHCGKFLTTPYLYYFDEFPFCPSCGKRVKGGRVNESVNPIEARRLH